ncbi:siderophore-iron reductase FhuF [Inquilinus sp. CAU 1745]|uniref:siderophore-iron reductase FhuF n=1 Tax=Inquilinus sp. CAU 1745 TaxID=3140369 RepID=UPI00325C0BD2
MFAMNAMAEPSAPDEPIADDRLLERVLTGSFAHLAGRIAIAPPGPRAVAAARLLDGPALAEALDLQAAPFGDADRRAVASLWSQYYFGALIGAVAAIGMAGGRTALPIDPDAAGIVLEGGLPAGLVLPHAGRTARPSEAARDFIALFRSHLSPMVDRLSAHAKASPRLFWGNAAAVLGWALGEACAMRPEAGDPALLRQLLLEDAQWPDGGPNPLVGALKSCDDPAVAVRRVCCVRYLLPGIPGCGPICPLGR